MVNKAREYEPADRPPEPPPDDVGMSSKTKAGGYPAMQPVTLPRATLPNPNVSISSGGGWLTVWIVVGAVVGLLVVAPAIAWTFHFAGPWLAEVGHAYLQLWPPESR